MNKSSSHWICRLVNHVTSTRYAENVVLVCVMGRSYYRSVAHTVLMDSREIYRA